MVKVLRDLNSEWEEISQRNIYLVLRFRRVEAAAHELSLKHSISRRIRLAEVECFASHVGVGGVRRPGRNLEAGM